MSLTECKCSLRTKLVGDGCEVCNPKLAEDARRENEAEAGKGEPDAWIAQDKRGLHLSTIYTRQDADYWKLHGAKVTAYYTTPRPCPRCVELKQQLSEKGTIVEADLQVKYDELESKFQQTHIWLCERNEQIAELEATIAKQTAAIDTFCKVLNCPDLLDYQQQTERIKELSAELERYKSRAAAMPPRPTAKHAQLQDPDPTFWFGEEK